MNVTQVLLSGMPVGEAVTPTQIKGILKDFPGMRTEAMRDLIADGYVVRVGKEFKRVK